MAESFVDENGQEWLVNDGEILGRIMQADDGALVLVDAYDDVVAAAGPDGQALDHSAYTLGDDTPEEFEPYVDEPYVELPPEPEPEVDWEAVHDAQAQADAELDYQSDSLRRRVGRELTQSEAQAIADVALRELNAGRALDLDSAAIEAIHESPDSFHHTDTQEGRRDLIMARVHDEGLDQPEPEPPPREFDLGTREGRADAVNHLVEAGAGDDELDD